MAAWLTIEEQTGGWGWRLKVGGLEGGGARVWAEVTGPDLLTTHLCGRGGFWYEKKFAFMNVCK